MKRGLQRSTKFMVFTSEVGTLITEVRFPKITDVTSNCGIFGFARRNIVFQTCERDFSITVLDTWHRVGIKYSTFAVMLCLWPNLNIQKWDWYLIWKRIDWLIEFIVPLGKFGLQWVFTYRIPHIIQNYTLNNTEQDKVTTALWLKEQEGRP